VCAAASLARIPRIVKIYRVMVANLESPHHSLMYISCLAGVLHVALRTGKMELSIGCSSFPVVWSALY
jgi:hypothetical protein